MIRMIKTVFAALFGSEKKFLCDSCRYDYGSACTRPERPNATKCPDYKRKG
jgi:hypothetical protein